MLKTLFCLLCCALVFLFGSRFPLMFINCHKSRVNNLFCAMAELDEISCVQTHFTLAHLYKP